MTQMQQFDGTEHISMYHEPERTSIASILGLVCSCIGCCGGLTAIPGIFLSIFGIVGVSRSKGRVGGMGFAIAGLLVGLLMLALWGGILGAASFMLGWMEKSAAAPVAQILRDIEADDFDAARAAMGPPASDVSDEIMIAFREGYLGSFGSVVSETHGVMGLIDGYGAVGSMFQNYQGRQNHIPFPLEFDSGMGLVVIEMDPQLQNTAGSMTVVPIRVILVGADGVEYVLPPYGWVSPGDVSGGDLSGVEVEDFSDDSVEEPDQEQDMVP